MTSKTDEIIGTQWREHNEYTEHSFVCGDSVHKDIVKRARAEMKKEIEEIIRKNDGCGADYIIEKIGELK